MYFPETDTQIIESAKELINWTPDVKRIGVDKLGRFLELHKAFAFWFLSKYGARLKDLDEILYSNLAFHNDD